MTNLYLVRHGKAAAGFGAHADPGLDDLGRTQANTAAQWLFEQLSPITLLTSPLARARETATPLEALWNTTARTESRVAELPTPNMDLQQRASWLQQAMQGSWSELDESLQTWRADLGTCLREQTEDVVIFSHYVAINAAVGLASNDSRMRIFAPDNASITHLRVDAQGELQVVELGRTAQTVVN